ncbi:MAG TPA: peptide deformylase [Methanocorpusculum sp.]|nr:peptide deformylase [Methanocorpusculum sp.]
MRICLYGEKVLTEVAKPVPTITQDLIKLLDEMIPFLSTCNGVGLAAPQIGISQRFFVMNIDNRIRKVINPEILSMSNTQIDIEEGCLSFPGIHQLVRRPTDIKVKYQTISGDYKTESLRGYDARVFQHEYDHLNGVLFLDRVNPSKMISVK